MTDVKISGTEYVLTPLNKTAADDALRRVLLQVENPKSVDLLRWKCTDAVGAQSNVMLTVDPLILFAVMGKKGKKIDKVDSAFMASGFLVKAGQNRKEFDAAVRAAIGVVKIPVNIDKFITCGMLMMFDFTVRLSIEFRFFKMTRKGDTSGDYVVIGLPFGTELLAVNVVPCERESDIKTTFSRVMQVRFAAPKLHGETVKDWAEGAKEAQARDNAHMADKARKKGVKVEKLPTPPK